MFKFDKRDAVGNALREPMERLPTEAGEAMGLAYEEGVRTRRTDAITIGLRDEYEPILTDIEKRTGKRLVNPAAYLGMTDSGSGDLPPSYLNAKVGIAPPNAYRAQLEKINEFIRRNQEELPDLLPIDDKEVLNRVIEKGRAAREEWALASEYSGKGATAAGFLGGTGAIVTDPPNIIATVAGMFFPPSRGLPFVLREAGLNASAELVAEPGKRKVAQTFGFQRDVGDMALDVGSAAAFGAGFAGTVEGVTRGFSYLRTLRNSKDPQERSAAIVHDRAREVVVGDNPSSYAEKTAAAESGGDLSIKAKTSSATGKFQFITDTWNDLSNETGVPPVIEGQPDPRLNEAYQDVQEAAYRKRSVKTLSEAGFVVDDTNLYLSHFLGQQGAVKFLQGLKASADSPATAFVDTDAVAANKSVFFKKNGQPKTAQEFYQWAGKKMGAPASGLPDQHLANYDNAIKALNEDAPTPEPAPIPGPMRAPHIEGLELVDPASVQVDAKTFQFKEGGDELGVTERLKGISKWEQDFAGVALVWERQDGARFIADGHQRHALALRMKEQQQTEPYNYTPMDLTQPTEGKVFYHGTKSGMTKLSEADVYQFSSAMNLYGEGLYLTDNPNVARSYSETKGKGAKGRVLSAKLKNVNLIDLEAPMPKAAFDVYATELSRYLDSAEVEALRREPGKAVFGALKRAMADEGLTTSDVLEVYGNLNFSLSGLGYDGLRHQGGGRVSRDLGSHNVVIVFEHVYMKDGVLGGRQLRDKIEDAEYTPPPPSAVMMNARILREVDGWTPEAVRVRAAVKNIAEGTGSPLDAARILRAARDADLPPLPPTSALVRQGRALAELADEPFMMVVNGVVPENYGAIVGRLLRDPKLQEAAIRVLNKTNPDNAVQAEAIVRQVADTEVATSTQVDLFGEEQISESLFLERAKVMDASLKSLKKDKAVFATLVNQADRIEGAGNRLSRETNLERMTQDAKVSEYIQKLASRKGPISDALTDAARKLKEGGRPGDATRSFLQAVRGAVDNGLDGGSGGRGSGQVVDSARPLEPAEIRAQQEFFEKEPEALDDLVSKQVDTALEEGRLSKDSAIYVEDATGNLVKRKVGDVLDEIDADQRLVNELTDCVQGAAEEAA